MSTYSVTPEGESYAAAWGLAHERTEPLDRDYMPRLNDQVRRDNSVEQRRRRGGRPRTQPTHCPRCGRKVYARGLCQAHYRAERRAA
jgi:hypothetical protein